MNDPRRSATQALPGWTWLAPLLVSHAGTWMSLPAIAFPGVAFVYLPIALAVVMTHWWGPRALVGVYVNALLCAPLWKLPISHGALHALPETTTALCSWLLFARWRRGDCAMSSRRATLEMIGLGMLLPCVIGGVLHLQVAALRDSAVADRWLAAGTFALSGFAALVAIGAPLLAFATEPMRSRGLALPLPGNDDRRARRSGDRSVAPDELARSEEFLRAALDSARMGVWSWDVETDAVTWSAAIEPMMGMEPGSFGGTVADFTRCVHAEDLEAVERAIADAIEGRTSEYFQEYRVQWPDRSIHWLEARGRVYQGASGRPERMTGTVVDVTQRHVAADELAQTQRRLSSIIETTPNVAIQLYDRAGRVLQWNKASEAMFGYAAEEALGKTLDATIHTPEESAAFLAALGTIEASGKPIGPAEYSFRRRDGSAGKCLSTTFKLSGADVFACMDIDVTANKQLEAQLLQAQKVESIGRLAGGVAHDFNNLLTSILGYADMLLAHAPVGSEQERFLRAISDGARRGGALTQQLLAFARRQVAQPVVLDLNARVQASCELLTRLIGEDIELAFVPGGALGRVKVDPVQIEQVLMNMAVNARDAMPRGGKLTISTRNVTVDERGAQAPEDVAPGEYVMIEIRDTGIGIAPEVLPNIFDPFFTTKPVGLGTGLGLATCEGIVKQCGGHILVSTELGKGTSFQVYLPRTHEHASPRPANAPAAPRAEGTETILMVEDDATIREMVATALERMGFTVHRAINGVEALEFSRRHPGRIDLLLTDVVMPKMGGKDLAASLRDERPAIGVLYTSGYTEDAVHRGGLEQGVSFLQKPYTPVVLARRIREVLDSR